MTSPQASERRGPPAAPADFQPEKCGERHLRLFDGNFDQFWSYAERHGWTGVGEFAWSVPHPEGEADAVWRARAKQCFLEVERRNMGRSDVVSLYTLGYFLWHGGTAFGFERDPAKQPGVRERGYRMLLRARQMGYEKASLALVGVHYSMVRALDTAALRRMRDGTDPSPTPEWWPSTDRLLEDLNAMGAKGLAGAFLSLSSIYRERWLMAEYFHIDHKGEPVRGPDPDLLKASNVYTHWYDTLRAEQNLTVGVPSPRP
ncbi:hypothetical protein KAJ83_17790 [Marivibrio halodurans]|uniref:Uncharacterized protein n=1 Tax=Marivibrio halodurans TaxID=2039722 RepID=A0A8J7SQ84_9PROT|nr:hypothetical protein [Marivibrio halodurans]MBP5858876.1 hypothetical protein [Marivibrio halodurans]